MIVKPTTVKRKSNVGSAKQLEFDTGGRRDLTDGAPKLILLQ